MNVTDSINSAIVSGQIGLQNASDGITEASINIANANATATTTEELLANAATQQLGNVSQLLPEAEDNLTSELVSLSVNSINAQASAEVLDVANDTVGTIIDALA